MSAGTGLFRPLNAADARMPDHAVITAAGEQPVLEFGLPRIKCGAPAVSSIGSVGDVVGAADEAVQRVHRAAPLGRQPARGPVVRRVVAQLHPAARLVRPLDDGSAC